MKKLLCVLLSVCLLITLTACHGKMVLQSSDKAVSSGYEIPDSFDTSRNFEISFWAKNDTNITQVEIYKKAIADFEALYPNIKVNLRLYTDYGRIYNDVITNIPTNTTPNVCITYPDHIATYLTGADTVVPLDELLIDPQYGLGGNKVLFDAPEKEEIVAKFLEECAFDNHYYAIPYMRSTEACYVNKTYVEKLGYTLPEVLTWDFVWEVSAAAAKKDAEGNFLVNGQKVMIPFIYKSTDNMMIQMLRQKNAEYSSEDGDVLIFNDTTQKILETVGKYTELGAFSTFKINGYPANFLNAGQCVFAIDSTAGATWMGSDAPLVDIPEEKLVEFETVVMPIPQFNTVSPRMISQGPSMCLFNKEDPQEVLASWLFAQFMLTNPVQIAYAQTEGYVPVTTKAQQSVEYQDYLSRSGEDNDLYYKVKLDATKLLLENTDNTFVTPVFNGSASLRNAAGQMIENVTKTVRRGNTVDAAYYEEMYAEVTALYRLDQIVTQRTEKEFGPLPMDAVFLLVGIAICWIGLCVYALSAQLKKKNRKNVKKY